MNFLFSDLKNYEKGELKSKKMKPAESFFKFLSSISPNTDDKLHPNDKFSRIKLLVKAGELARNNFPLPLPGYKGNSNTEFVLTSDNYKEVWLALHILSVCVFYVDFIFIF